MQAQLLDVSTSDTGPGRIDTASPREDRVLRFRVSERRIHWAIAAPFLVCYVTAVILVFVYNPAPSRPFRALVSWTHRLSAICFIVLPMLAAFRARRDIRIHFYNIKQGWLWTLSDLKWLLLMGLAAINKKTPLPEQGKFNAAEKLNFMMVMTTYPLFILTGILVWLPGVAFWSWILHFFMAVVATPLVLGHIFMATINPGTRVGLQGMISGYVDRQWAKHHYRRWYRENFEQESLAAPAEIRCPSCRATRTVASWAELLRTVYEGEPLECSACGIEMGNVRITSEPRSVESFLEFLRRGQGPHPDQWQDLSRPPRAVPEARPAAPES